MGAGAGMAGAQMVHESFGQLGTMIANHKAQEDAQDFAKHMYKHRYRYTRQDMEKAGLNPILGMMGNNPGTPPTSAAQARHSSPGSSGAAAAYKAGTAGQLDKAKVKTEATVAEANSAMAAKAKADTARTAQQTIMESKELPASEMKHDIMKGVQGLFDDMKNSMSHSASNIRDDYRRDLEAVKTWLQRNPNALPYNPKPHSAKE